MPELLRKTHDRSMWVDATGRQARVRLPVSRTGTWSEHGSNRQRNCRSCRCPVAPHADERTWEQSADNTSVRGVRVLDRPQRPYVQRQSNVRTEFRSEVTREHVSLGGIPSTGGLGVPPRLVAVVRVEKLAPVPQTTGESGRQPQVIRSDFDVADPQRPLRRVVAHQPHFGHVRVWYWHENSLGAPSQAAVRSHSHADVRTMAVLADRTVR